MAFSQHGSYEAGYSNPAWASQMQASVSASDRFRRNSFFPHAASQVERADQIVGGMGGPAPLPGLYGSASATPRTPVAPQVTPQAMLREQYKKQYDQYKTDTDKNRADVLSGYDSQRAEALGLLTGGGGGGFGFGSSGGIGGGGGFGGGPQTEEEIRLQQSRRANEARLVEQGISSSTLADEQSQAFDRAKNTLDWNKKMDLVRVLGGIGTNKLNTMENTRYVPPDTNQLLDIERMAGSGNQQGLEQPQVGGGPPVVSGNPYGAFPQQGGGGGVYGQPSIRRPPRTGPRPISIWNNANRASPAASVASAAGSAAQTVLGGAASGAGALGRSFIGALKPLQSLYGIYG